MIFKFSEGVFKIEDQFRFVDLLLNPPAPAPALERAMEAHSKLIQP